MDEAHLKAKQRPNSNLLKSIDQLIKLVDLFIHKSFWKLEEDYKEICVHVLVIGSYRHSLLAHGVCLVHGLQEEKMQSIQIMHIVSCE